MYLRFKVSFWYFMSLSSTWLIAVQHAMHFWLFLLQCFWLMWWCNILLKDMNTFLNMCLAFVAAEACFLIKYLYIFTIILISNWWRSGVQLFCCLLSELWLDWAKQYIFQKPRNMNVWVPSGLKLIPLNPKSPMYLSGEGHFQSHTPLVQ